MQLDSTNSVPMALSRTTYKGTSTKKGKRLPGSTIVPGAQYTPRKRRLSDRTNVKSTGVELVDWRRPSRNVNGPL